MNNTFMGYTIHSPVNSYTATTVIFSKQNEKITANDIIKMADYALNFIATHDTTINKYRIALKFFNSIKLIFTNKTSQNNFLTKDETTLIIDVFEEIFNSYAKTEEEKKNNASNSLLCKLLIGVMHG